MPPRKQLPL
jgi:arginine decarboxylase-like protein